MSQDALDAVVDLLDLEPIEVNIFRGQSPDEDRPRTLNELPGRFMASPAVSGNALFLRTDTHLYRIERE